MKDNTTFLYQNIYLSLLLRTSKISCKCKRETKTKDSVTGRRTAILAIFRAPHSASSVSSLGGHCLPCRWRPGLHFPGLTALLTATDRLTVLSVGISVYIMLITLPVLNPSDLLSLFSYPAQIPK